MTYPIFLRLLSGQQKLGKLPNTLSLAEQRRPVQTSHRPFFNICSSMDTWGNLSNLWISCVYLFGQGIPVEYEWDKFNTPHIGRTLFHPKNLLCRWWCLIPSRHLALISPLGNINGDTPLPKPTRHTKLTVTPKFISSNGKQDFR